MGTRLRVLLVAVLGVGINIFVCGENCMISKDGKVIDAPSDGIGLLKDVGQLGEIIRQYETDEVQNITVGNTKYLDVVFKDSTLSVVFTANYRTWEKFEKYSYKQPTVNVKLHCSDGESRDMMFYGIIDHFSNGYDPVFEDGRDEFLFVIPMPFPAGLSVTLNFGTDSNKIVVIDYDRNENDANKADVTFDLAGDGSELFEIRTANNSKKQYTAELRTKQTLQLRETLAFQLIATDNDEQPTSRSSYATILIEPDLSTLPVVPPMFQEPLYTINVTESQDIEVFFEDGYDQDKTTFKLSHRSGEDLTSFFIAEKSSESSVVVKKRSEIPDEMLERYFGVMLLEATTEGVTGKTVIQVILPGSNPDSTTTTESTTESTTTTSEAPTGTTESSTNPGTTESSTSNTDTSESSTTNSSTTDSSTSNTDTTESSTTNSSTTDSSTSNTDTTESSTTNSSTTDSSTSNTDTTESSTTNSSTTDSSTSNTDTTESSTTNSSTTESSTSNTDTTESSTTNSSTTESSTSNTDTTESSTTNSSTTDSSTSNTDTTESSTTNSSTTESSTSNTDTTESSTTNSSTTDTSTSNTDTTESSTTNSSPTESSTSNTDTTESSTTNSSTTESSTSNTDTTESSTSNTDPTESSTTNTDPTESSTTDSSTSETATSNTDPTASPTADPTSSDPSPTEPPTTIGFPVENLWDYTVLLITLNETTATSVHLAYTRVIDMHCNFSLEVDPSGAAGLFTIDANGTVSTAAPIDRESKIFNQSNIVRLKLFRNCDNPAYSRSSSGEAAWTNVGPQNVEYYVTGEENAMLMVVKVEDVNDNRPFFREKSLTVGYPSKDLVMELLPPSLVTVQAIDLDIGDNAKIEYMIGGSRRVKDEEHDDDDDHDDDDHDNDPGDDNDATQFVVHKDTGVVYPRQRTFRYQDMSFSVLARDSVGVGAEGSLQINVRILKKDNMAVIYQEGSTLEDTQKVLESLQNAAGLKEVLAISAAVVADDDQDRRKTSLRKDEVNTLLRLVVYGIDIREKLVPASSIIRVADETPGVVKAEEWNPSSVVAVSEASTALVIPVIILAVLLLISAAAVAFLIHKLRHPQGASSRGANNYPVAWWKRPIMFSNCFGSSYEAFSGTSSNQGSVTSMDAGNNPKNGIQMSTLNIERETPVAEDLSDSNRSSVTLGNAAGESDDSVSQDGRRDSLVRRKSLVTFNENVEQIEIEKL